MRTANRKQALPPLVPSQLPGGTGMPELLNSSPGQISIQTHGSPCSSMYSSTVPRPNVLLEVARKEVRRKSLCKKRATPARSGLKVGFVCDLCVCMCVWAVHTCVWNVGVCVGGCARVRMYGVCM